jgi:hypothetical protein
MLIGSSKIYIIANGEHGFGQGCKVCKRIHLTGAYAIGIRIEAPGVCSDVLVAVDPMISCCGEQKPFFELFDTKEEALRRKDEIVAHINEHHTAEGLPLIPSPFVLDERVVN